jgi:biotin synthase
MQTFMDLNKALQLGLDGTPLTVDQAMELIDTPLNDLCEVANAIREKHCGNRVHTCSIVNARSGRCSEDCKWCAQSAHHSTGVNEYEYIDEAEMMAAYADNAAHGVQRFSLVTSGRKVPKAHMGRFCQLLRKAGEQGKMSLCASMGLLEREQLQQLYDAGVRRYHCNLETSSDFFPTLCTTHTHEDKIRTIRAAREVGMEVCTGGIIGMGENMRQRLTLAAEAREAGAHSIPVNLLNPIKGTPLQDAAPLSEEEVIRTVALMRLVAPKPTIFFAGGRAQLSVDAVKRMLRGGVNGALVGNMLTTVGNDMDADFKMFNDCGYTK